MSKTISVALKTHLQNDVTSLASCVKITRRDGTIFGMTDLDKDITFSSVLYKADVGYKRTSVETGDSFQVDNVDIEGILNSGSLNASDIRKGLYDYAEVEIFILNYKDLSMGALTLRVGWLGEVRINQKGVFKAEIRGLNQSLHTVFGDIYESSCDADLGNLQCGVDLNSITITGVVSYVQLGSTRVFQASAITGTSEGYYASGGLKFTTGLNSGKLIEVKNYMDSLKQFEMFLSFPYNIEIGDEFEVYPGCNKIITTCRDKFNNVSNFRGEPYIPGMDKANSYPLLG